VPVNPLANVIVGDAATVKVAGKTTVIVLPDASDPPLFGVNPTVQVSTANAACVGAVNVTPVTDDATIVTVDGLAAAVFLLVATLNVVGVPAAGFVTPGIVSVAAVLAASAHVLVSVIVTVGPALTTPVAAHVPVNPLANVIVGDAATVKVAGKTTVIVSVDASDPLADGVNPTVQVSTANAACVGAVNVTPVTDVAALACKTVIKRTATTAATAVSLINECRLGSQMRSNTVFTSERAEDIVTVFPRAE
jgi:hypothetical protein